MFILPVRISLFHAAVTWISFWVLGVPLRSFATFVSFFLALFPFLPGWLGILPWVLFASSGWLTAVLLLSVHSLLFSQVDPLIHGSLRTSHYYATGLSIVVGLSAFGMQGILLGPLLVCVGHITYGVVHIDQWHRLTRSLSLSLSLSGPKPLRDVGLPRTRTPDPQTTDADVDVDVDHEDQSLRDAPPTV